MRSSFKTAYMANILRILVLFLAVKLLWFAAEMIWFPAKGITHAEDRHSKPLYYKIKITQNNVQKPAVVKKKPVGSIKDIKLLAVYHASDVTVVTVKYKGKSKVLGKGESINGFVLDGAGNDFAIFQKNGKMYQLDMIKPKRRGVGRIQPVSVVKTVSPDPSGSEDYEGEITDAGDHKIVDKSLFDHYVKNMDEIYKNIGITEIKKDGRIDGFKITFVKRGSPFAKLGVKRGDILKSVNGQELTSYNAAFEAYRNMGDVDNVTLVIQRGNKKMELEYEIN